MLFRSLYQDLSFLQPVRSGRDIVGALARSDRMELREIVRMLFRLRALRDRYPSASLRIAVGTLLGLAAYLVARRSG
jgi:hypothetical protein